LVRWEGRVGVGVRVGVALGDADGLRCPEVNVCIWQVYPHTVGAAVSGPLHLGNHDIG
jgi:hypothetical protein